jgi:hypothetical protein
MKITALAALAMVAVGANAAETVQICSEISPGAINYFRARNIATQMFAGIGVGIEWHNASSCPAGAIRVSFSTTTPAALLPGALAYALPYEGTHIVIFYDRVHATVIDPDRATALMAHVMAHEITHVLEGVSRHSEEGVLKAHWTPADFSQMCVKPLKFADEDIALIHLGIEKRVGHPADGE